MADGGLVKVDDKLFGLFNAVVRSMPKYGLPISFSLSLSRVFVRPSISKNHRFKIFLRSRLRYDLDR